MLRKLYRRMPIGYFVRFFYRIWFCLLFVPRFLWNVLIGRIPENTDPICERTSDQLDVTSSTTSDDYQNLETDELYCEYDSTWEKNSSTTKETNRQRRHQSFRFKRFREASRDMQNYRHDYPEKYTRKSQENATPNLDFYLGKRRSLPDDFSIEEFHHYWFGDYQRLENVHSFIQWLFPLQEPGVNWQAFELTKEEIKAFQKNQKAKENLLTSYKLMLDFYGLQLSNETTGEVKKSPMWQNRFSNLNRNTHNNLRITRILKCLGTLGYPHYQAPLVHFFLQETLVNQNLPNVKESVLNYFMFTVLDKMKRKELIKYAYHHFDESEFVWCPKMIQMKWNEVKENKAVATCDQNTEPRSSDEEEIMDFDHEYQADVYLKQASAFHQTSHLSREPAQMYSSDEEENNEAEDNADFKQESTVHKTSQHRQPVQKYSSDEEENNEAEDNADFKQESTVRKTSQHRQPVQKYSSDEEENNEAEDDAGFKQESTVRKTSQHSQPAQKHSSDEVENNEAEDNADFKQESTVRETSQHRQPAQKFSSDEEENNEAEDNTDFKQESTVRKTSQHSQRAQKHSSDEVENNEAEDNADFKQESTVHKTSQHRQPVQKYSSDEEENNEAEDNADFKQESTVRKTSQHRQPAQKYSSDEVENNEAEDDAGFKQESTVRKTSQHSQPAQKHSSDEVENNEAEDNADFKQESTVRETSQHRQPAQKFSSDEEENNEAEDNTDFKQESTVRKTSQHRQPAQKFSSDEEENNEDQAKVDLGSSPNNTDSPGTNVNLSVSSTNNSQSTTGKDIDLSTNLYAEQVGKSENSSGQAHSPENHSMDPTDSNVNPSDSSTINSSQKSDGEKTDESHADLLKHGQII